MSSLKSVICEATTVERGSSIVYVIPSEERNEYFLYDGTSNILERTLKRSGVLQYFIGDDRSAKSGTTICIKSGLELIV